MAFDITAALRGVTAAENAEHLEQVELHLIDNNPKNFYSMDGIVYLAANIGTVGLLDPPRVRKTEQGRYMLISGHRRRQAMRMLADDPDYPDWDMHRKIPVIVEAEDQSVPGIEDPEKAGQARELMQELKLVFANSDTRNMTSADTATQVRKTTELLTRLKALGYPLKGKIRDHVAEITKVSQTRIARLQVIERNLKAPLLYTAWKNGKLGETAAYECARYDKDVQQSLNAVEVTSLYSMTVEQVQAIMEGKKAEAEELRELKKRMDEAMKPFVDAAARMDEEEDEAEQEEKAEAKAAETVQTPKFDGHGHLEYDASEYLERRAKEDDLFFELLCRLSPMYFDELGALNSRQEGIELLKDRFGRMHDGGNSCDLDRQSSPKGLQLRKRICDKPITRSWTDVYDMLCTIALNDMYLNQQARKREKVSAADTGPKWETGRPPVSGLYVVKCGVPAEEGPLWTSRRVIVWTGDAWVSNGPGVPVKENVYGWYKIPEE